MAFTMLLWHPKVFAFMRQLRYSTLMKPLIAGNWKMNKLPSESETWVRELTTKLQHIDHTHAEIALCVPFTHIASMTNVLVATVVRLGSQDVSAHDSGAYTGEVSASMLKDLGVCYAIVGHSERRDYHQESDAVVCSKAQAALSHGLIPIVCVGESLTQRDAGQADEVVVSQLNASLAGISLDKADDLVIAYEPIWAIGTGKTATAEDAQAMCHTIRETLSNLYPNLATEIRILYGGSMKPGNAQELLTQADINGGLIGGASLKTPDLLAIVEAGK
ncbi:MAG: triose-phosphate isomerase [Deinococcota bacterium]